jgi:FAD synthase
LPNFQGDLYDQVLDVAFLAHLRGERTFATLEDLLAQMARDVEQSCDIFEEFNPGATLLLG